jgi:hypothetical protein
MQPASVRSNAVISATTKHSLYAAALSATITGFTGAAGVKMGAANINVIDQQNAVGSLDIFFATGTSSPTRSMKRRSTWTRRAKPGLRTHAAVRSGERYERSGESGRRRGERQMGLRCGFRAQRAREYAQPLKSG